MVAILARNGYGPERLRILLAGYSLEATKLVSEMRTSTAADGDSGEADAHDINLEGRLHDRSLTHPNDHLDITQNDVHHHRPRRKFGIKARASGIKIKRFRMSVAPEDLDEPFAEIETRAASHMVLSGESQSDSASANGSESANSSEPRVSGPRRVSPSAFI